MKGRTKKFREWRDEAGNKKVGRPCKYTSVVQLQRVIDSYFTDCDKDGKPYTVTGLAYTLNLSRQGLNEYKGKSEFSDTIKKAKLRIEEFLEKRLLSNACITGVIFNLKNNFGWQDKADVAHTGDIVINLTRENG